jgi:putative membrane protein
MGGSLLWLLQWPIRALILLLVSKLPLGVEIESLPIALVTSIVIGLLGTLLIWPLKAILAPVRAITTLFGLLPLGWFFDWLISIILFAVAAWMIRGFRLTNGLTSAVLGALVYSILSAIALRTLGLDVPLTRAATFVFGGAAVS